MSETKTKEEIYGRSKTEQDGAREEEPDGEMKPGDWWANREEKDTLVDPFGPHRLQQCIFRKKWKKKKKMVRDFL